MQEIINKALEVLRNGGVILYPTDTIWGLGCDACNPTAVHKVYEIKKRSDSKALVLLAANLDMVAKFVKEIPPMAVELVEVNNDPEDKPLTLIYPGAIVGKAPQDGSSELGTGDRFHLAFNLVAEDGSVAMRIPNMEFCRSLALKLGRPIVSTSANISGEPSPARFSDIPSEIRDAVDYIVPKRLDATSSGKASQIIKVEMDGEVKIIRM